MTNPFAPLPYGTAAGTYVSGGGGDGQINTIVSLCLRRANARSPWSPTAVPDAPDPRTFDLAELISHSAAQAGSTVRLPLMARELERFCHTRKTIITVEEGVTLKGALLFGQSAVALSLGSRGRAIIYSERTGIIVDDGVRTWTAAATIPGARGYR